MVAWNSSNKNYRMDFYSKGNSPYSFRSYKKRSKNYKQRWKIILQEKMYSPINQQAFFLNPIFPYSSPCSQEVPNHSNEYVEYCLTPVIKRETVLRFERKRNYPGLPQNYKM